MSENPIIPQSNLTGQNPNLAVKNGKTYVWKPKNDIRISELARCITFVTHPICHDLSLIDSDCLRHFEVIES